ncbi:halocyanin [Haloprofundus marisrubri]|uniref:Halocyanin n=1 Tax=Haloprofundus marisrubri TaxID=1514971 RepID=A0A0W1R8G2_9EURY|nr:halocyanin [Haloprofundus marisrubri]
MEVPPETFVEWDWTGHGGQHNVVALDGTFDSGRTNAQKGTSYEYLFLPEETGVYRFVSEPHRDEGMKGAVIVKEPPTTGIEEVDEWVQLSNTFDGTITDKTNTDTTTITTGAEGNRGTFAFDPVVLKISSGTTVQWEWAEDSGPHTVAFEDIDVRTDEVYTEAGVHLEYTFEEKGIYRYACEPHESLGGRGAIIVE